MEADRIGIPPQLVDGEKGLRIPFQKLHDGLLVFDKPQGLLSKADPWYPQCPDLETGFNSQIPDGKPELEHHGVTEVRAFNPLDPGSTGAVLATFNEDHKAEWRNAYGSYQFRFHALLIARKSDRRAPVTCTLPLVRHFKNKKMLVSHNLGKKSYTRFTPLLEGRNADAWLASSRYPRLHQFRVHAMESGFPMLREPWYDAEYPRELFEENPHQLEWLHYYAIDLRDTRTLPDPPVFVDPPKYWKRNLRKSGIEIEELTGKAREIIENIPLPIE